MLRESAEPDLVERAVLQRPKRLPAKFFGLVRPCIAGRTVLIIRRTVHVSKMPLIDSAHGTVQILCGSPTQNASRLLVKFWRIAVQCDRPSAFRRRQQTHFIDAVSVIESGDRKRLSAVFISCDSAERHLFKRISLIRSFKRKLCHLIQSD